METMDYSEVLPAAPGVDLAGWLLREGGFDTELLIYRSGRIYEPLEERSREGVEVLCTRCGERFQAEKVSTGTCSAVYSRAPFGWVHPESGERIISGQLTVCPWCGREAAARHIGGDFERSTREDEFVTTFTTWEGRDELWSRRNELPGTLCEVRYKEISANKHGGQSLQFPVFVTLRDDKREVSVTKSGLRLLKSTASRAPVLQLLDDGTGFQQYSLFSA